MSEENPCRAPFCQRELAAAPGMRLGELCEMQHAIIESAGLAVVATDAAGTISYINSAAQQMLGYAWEDVVGRCSPMIFHVGEELIDTARSLGQRLGRGVRPDFSLFVAALDGGQRLEQRFTFVRKDGKRLPVNLQVAPLRGPDGEMRGFLGIAADISHQKQAESEIHQLAFYDALTELPNRRLFLNRLAKTLAGAGRKRSYGALLLIDLDNFKTLNDTLGHDVGDRLLKEVASRLRRGLRKGDTAARQGGDEFVVLIESLDGDEAAASLQAGTVAEKIRAALCRPYKLLGSGEYYHSASIGISLFRGREKPLELLLKQADIALYKAKDAGRNTIRFFDAAMQSALERRSQLEAGLRQALGRGEFVLHVQPQVDAESRLTGGELLLRWQRPDRSLLPPADFIPLAEETGLIVPIGQWVLDQACAALRRWSASPLTSELYLAVNVSARQFRQPDFVEQVRDTLARHAADPQRLKLELTESLLLDNVEETVRKMEALRELGVRFTLDDFGTGYASLSYLKRFPFQQLKVDQSFVRDIATDPDDAAIVSAIIALGESLHLGVVAEGVEEDDQHACLVASGCKAFQGFLFSRPLHFAQFESQLAARGANGRWLN